MLSLKGPLLGMLLAVATQVSATQEYILPTLFDVTGVAADDVLNIRAAPDANAAIVGTLAPDARDIEVVGHDDTGQWAQVNAGERSGWAALRFLAYQVDVWPPEGLPPSLHCIGTEPFWSFRPGDGAILFSTPEMQESSLRIDAVMSTGVFREPRRSVIARGQELGMTAVIVPMACSDGMSDRAYGLDVTAILEDQGDRRLLTGCCSIAPR